MKLTHGAYILARFSTDRQEADSIEVQVSKCREWCERQRLPVLDVFADEAVSGMKETRPQFDRMMRLLSEGGADTVVIYDQSRMFRKMTAWFTLRERLERLGVRVVSVTQPMIGGDLRDPATFMSEGGMALMNQMWVLQTRQKVCEKMRWMAEQGKYTGGVPPLGYVVIDGRIEVCEPEAETVRIIFGDYAAGRSYREIIQRLNAEGRRTKSGGTFGSNSLHDLLKNEKYIGVLTYGRTQKRPDGSRNSHAVASTVMRMEDMIPAIVDRETWDTVQEKLMANKRKQAGRPVRVREYPLKGKVFCGECKASMSVTCSQGGYYYYACSEKKRKKTCDNMPIKVDDLERMIAEAIKNMLGNPENVDGLICILREERGKIQEQTAIRMKALFDRQAEIKKQLDAAMSAVLAGMHSQSLIDTVHALEAEQSQNDREMTTLHNQAQGTTIPEDRLRELLKVAANDITALLSVVVRVEVGKDRIRVWTLLDAKPDGTFDFNTDWDDPEIGLIIIPGVAPPVPRIIINGGLLCFSLPRQKKNRAE